MNNALDIRANGILAGRWFRNAGTGGSALFQYDEDWVRSPAGRPISLSLPFTPNNAPHTGKTVDFFFDNLLPDSMHIRRRIRTRFHAASEHALDLLAAVGRDCVGALQFLPPGTHTGDIRQIAGTPLTTEGVAREIQKAVTGTLAADNTDDDSFRISIAGAQEKTALLYHAGKWQRPIGATPTTHILKLPLGLVGNMQADMSTSVENEWLCLRLFDAFDLPAAQADIAHFGDFKVLVVKRFDRALQPDGWIARLPQEDFCQALGISAGSKYEADGGPGIDAILRVLNHGSRPATDKRAFLKACILFWLLAATDGHAKNFSLFRQRGGAYRLTPFYDILSAWPFIGRGTGKIDPKKVRLAMCVRAKNPHWKMCEILPRHWDFVAKKHGLSDMPAILDDIIATAPAAIDRVASALPKNFPQTTADAIFSGMRSNLALLKK